MTRSIDHMYRDHGHVVLRRARAILRSEAAAADCVQDIFMGLVQRPDQLDGVVKITAWLYRTTTFYCLNKLRDQRGRRRLLETLRPASTVEARSDAIAVVRDVLDRLPEPLGEVAIYHHLDGMTYDEIASILGCSRRQVGYLLERLHAFGHAGEPDPLAWPEEQQS